MTGVASLSRAKGERKKGLGRSGHIVENSNIIHKNVSWPNHTSEEMKTIFRTPSNLGNAAVVIIEQLTPHGLLANIPHNHVTRSGTCADNVSDFGVPGSTKDNFVLCIALHCIALFVLKYVLCDFTTSHSRLCKFCNFGLFQIGNIDKEHTTIIATDTYLLSHIVHV